MRSLVLAAAVAALLVGHALPLGSQDTPPGATGTAPELSVFLLTMGQGDLVWEKFGHNAIWIHDPAAGTDNVYNYGVFDFDAPDYWSRFLRGDWLYQLAVFDISRTLAQYRYFDRTVVAQELNLTAGEKRELQEFLEWNARPQNREYLYDYYRDNCSTRLRDVLDRVLGGQIRERAGDRPTETTYRWHSRRLIASDRLAYTGLAAGLGPAADRRISEWEEMFLPTKLMESVREVRVRRDGTSQPLVLSERVLYESEARGPERAQPPAWLVWYLLAGVAIGGVLVALGRVARRGRAGRFAFAAVSGLWALVVGTGGVLLLGLWGLTNHTIAHRNENLFQFDPLALGLALLVPALVYGARWAARPARWLAIAVAALSVLGFALQLLPAFDQVNGEIIALLLPGHLALAWAVDRLGEA